MIPKRILIIQTAFIGDVILTTGLVEKLKAEFPDASIDFLLRKGNEQLFENNPHINKLLIWDKKSDKLKNLFRMISVIRKERYDLLVNLQRYFSTGLMVFLSGAKYKVGFSQNPLSFCYDNKVAHQMSNGQHDIERNHELISDLVSSEAGRPKLYPSDEQFNAVAQYKGQPFITIAPASVWFTKQFPEEKWVEFLNQLSFEGNIYFVGAPNDKVLCDRIIENTTANGCSNLCGAMSLLESAALMKDAAMNYVNDSAPQHICSALDAPVTALFCSTILEFGFGPLSTNSRVVETQKELDCRPCGKHGHPQCPEGHFDCALSIDVERLNF
ncbi:MAG: glycosyltransferase family 9 protein [Cyclobacteriaceae bacterium]